MKELIDEINNFLLLQENWDGEFADSPSIKSIENANKFLQEYKFVNLPESMLHANGNVSLFWSDANSYFEIEFIKNERMAFFASFLNEKYKGNISRNEEWPTKLTDNYFK